jgi:hypothetical protein
MSNHNRDSARTKRLARRCLVLLGTLLRSFRPAVRTMVLRLRGASDVTRWQGGEALSPNWDERTQLLGRFVPANSSVIEFGAARLVLPSYLPPGCTYTASDIVKRSPETIVIDLNARELPPIPTHDVAVLGGVLEYVHDVRRLARQLAQSTHTVVASYAVRDRRRFGLSWLRRRSSGWVNDYTKDQLIGLFESCGFECAKTAEWSPFGQWLFQFARKD